MEVKTLGKIIEFGSDARSKILVGMDEAERAVISTLGPKGKTVILDNKTRHPTMTKDGISVLEFIDFSDKYKRLGVDIIREATHKVNGECGDGSTTTTLLTAELCKEGNKLINQDFDSIDVQKGFQKAAADVIDVLNKQKKLVESEDDILHIATISANNDEEIGSVIKEAFTNVGEDGIVNANVARNRNGKTVITYSNGLEIPRGYFTSECTNAENDTCRFEKPKFFVYGDLLDDLTKIAPIFQMCPDGLVIIAPAYSPEFKSAFAEMLKSKKVRAVATGPVGSTHDIMLDNLKDIAVMVHAKVFGGKGGEDLDRFNTSYLGSAESITVTANKTIITNGAGTDEEIQEQINLIKSKIEKSTKGEDSELLSEYEIRFLQERIASLSGGIATIWIGGFTDLEVKEKKDRYEDAINAVNAAISDGILAGGGAGLLHAIKTVQDSHKRLENADQEKGYQCLLKTLEKPARTIIGSTGKDPGYYIEKIKESNNVNFGYNAKLEKESDNLYRDGVIDPAKVEIMAIQYATSIAGTFINSNCLITPDTDNCYVAANDDVMDREGATVNYECE